nr:hypothetical protein [Bacteroidales bacterium]
YLNGKFYCTGHNEQKLYMLEFPPHGMTMQWTGTMDIPFKGQGIAIDREGNLWGVDRENGTVMMAKMEMEIKKPVKIRVGTYNLRRAPLDAKSPDNNWTVREPRLIQSILQCGFDLCGLQEVDTPEQESILRKLSEAGVEYGSYFFSPYAEDGVGTKAHLLHSTAGKQNQTRLWIPASILSISVGGA